MHHDTALFYFKPRPPMDKTPENHSNSAPKRIKDIIDTYYPEIKKRLSNGTKIIK